MPQYGPRPQNHGHRPMPRELPVGTGPGMGQPGRDIAPWRPGELVAPPQVATGVAMKERSVFGVWLGLPLITLGIYSLVWYYKIHREMADFDPRRSVPVAGPMLVLLFLGWTGIAPLISFYNTGRRIADAQRAAGIQVTCNPVLGLLLCFVFGLQVLYYQGELNKIVDAFGARAGTEVVLAG
jgi:hypothetical protein